MADLNALMPDYQANLGVEDALNVTDVKIKQGRLGRNWAERSLPSLQNYYASRGTFRGGQANLKAAQGAQDVMDESGDLERLLARQGADMARKRLLATAGVFA